MKVNELRIGNLVYQKRSDSYSDREDKIEDFVFRVILVGDDVVKIDMGFGARQRFEKAPIFSPTLKSLKPIPLTSEWLERLGFMCTIPRLRHETDEYLIEHWGTAGVYFFRVRTSKSESIMVAEVNFIHQLQNLYFALTGKEIELTKQLFQK